MMNDADDSSLTGRVKRYAAVGAAMGGAAARLAAGKLTGAELDADRLGQELRKALGGLKGPAMKVAQILATIPDAVPPALAAQLVQLQANAPAMGAAFVKRRMVAELGADWRSKFGTFDTTASHAASLGQVHRATTPDGMALACKLQYPDMASAVEADLQQLGLLLGVYERFDGGVRTDLVQAELAARLREELDYGREAHAQALYRLMLADTPEVSVPKPLPELSTKRLLTMQWLEGAPLMQFKDAPAETRNTLAMALFRAWYSPFYRYGVIHGDPHPGNYTVRADLGLNLLDFGCVRIFPPKFVAGVIGLYRALLANDRDATVAAYEAWGFTTLSVEMIEVLNMWARFVYAPVLEDRTQSMERTNNTRYGRETAFKVHDQLRRLGGVQVPREFVFLDRAAVGLGGVFLQLQAEINWYQMFQELIADFDAAVLAQRQAEALVAAGHPDAAPTLA
jgi:predicted unusual protein kinase regulating ubiquinone biosynthesis (AarF/ABC1/UbiB family)